MSRFRYSFSRGGGERKEEKLCGSADGQYAKKKEKWSLNSYCVGGGDDCGGFSLPSRYPSMRMGLSRSQRLI